MRGYIAVHNSIGYTPTSLPEDVNAKYMTETHRFLITKIGCIFETIDGLFALSSPGLRTSNLWRTDMAFYEVEVDVDYNSPEYIKAQKEVRTTSKEIRRYFRVAPESIKRFSVIRQLTPKELREYNYEKEYVNLWFDSSKTKDELKQIFSLKDNTSEVKIIALLKYALLETPSKTSYLESLWCTLVGAMFEMVDIDLIYSAFKDDCNLYTANGEANWTLFWIHWDLVKELGRWGEDEERLFSLRHTVFPIVRRSIIESLRERKHLEYFLDDNSENLSKLAQERIAYFEK